MKYMKKWEERKSKVNGERKVVGRQKAVRGSGSFDEIKICHIKYIKILSRKELK